MWGTRDVPVWWGRRAACLFVADAQASVTVSVDNLKASFDFVGIDVRRFYSVVCRRCEKES
jgi:hypothetical protein